MRVLVACEFSGVVREAFARRGHDAWSCDLLPSVHPLRLFWEDDAPLGKHMQCDVREVLDCGWDLMIAHPPCTYLSTCGNRHLKQPGRNEMRQEAFAFFMEMYNAPIERVCVENPHGYPNTAFRKPDQTIHPYYFGDPRMKRTGLWLRNLPSLKSEGLSCPKPEPSYWTPDGRPKYFTHVTKDHSKGSSFIERSVFSKAIAEQMAEQWG